MSDSEKPVDDLLFALKERAKELNCLYEIEELFSKPDLTLTDILQGMIRAIPPGWQYPDVCEVHVTVENQEFQSPGWKETPWVQKADVMVQDQVVGRIAVSYTEEMPAADEGPFLKEERKLINTIADRLERRLFHERMKTVFENRTKEERSQTAVIIDLLKKTDAKLLIRISRKMLNFLSWSGLEEAKRLLTGELPEQPFENENKPAEHKVSLDLAAASDQVFEIAVRYFGEQKVLNTIQEWIVEDRSNFMMKILENSTSSLSEIIQAIERFQHGSAQGIELSAPREEAFRVSLIRRLLNDDPIYIQVAKRFLEVKDFHELWRHIIFPAASHGRVGGKGSGLFLAERILRKSSRTDDDLRPIRTPKTWYLTSDSILHFINHNDLEEVLEQKYEDLAQVRQDYPYIVHVFKNSPLPQEILNGLSAALDDFGETPLVVRSSSLLEDRRSASFAGKYKSLFIANQGTKEERLRAVAEAVTEVYASTFNPDAIEYRAEHGMIDTQEEMGVLIQQVVGRKIGDFFLPAFAGVAFSANEFRWSPKIRKEDGLLRMVPGLGTRAVDRLSDDYPVLLSPGQPGVSVNVTPEEKIWYSPKKLDVVNLKTNTFETIDLRELLRLHGDQYPMILKMISTLKKEGLKRPGSSSVDFSKENYVVTFEGVIEDTGFIRQIRSLLNVLQTEMNGPVDIEFAHDGENLYLVQCRYLSGSSQHHAPGTTFEVPAGKVLFSANRYISTGSVRGITHIIYVDPVAYGEMQDRSDLLGIGRAIGKLNQLLPKKRFILMGPGRWGSRGDIKRGVSVTYSDIKNTAMLIEIARKQHGFMPELSFGTHFFQDLIEASIYYLPLYPDQTGVVFHEEFLLNSPNVFKELVPDMGHLEKVIRVIDVSAISGTTLDVVMNGERDQAVAVLTERLAVPGAGAQPERTRPDLRARKDETHWRWRIKRIEELAGYIDPMRFGIKAMYVFGSTKDATAGPQSDIDLLIQFQGNPDQEKELMAWLEGWSLCLSEENFQRTGHKTGGLLDIHVVTDADISNRTSFATKIGSITDPPRPLPLGRNVRKPQ